MQSRPQKTSALEPLPLKPIIYQNNSSHDVTAVPDKRLKEFRQRKVIDASAIFRNVEL